MISIWFDVHTKNGSKIYRRQLRHKNASLIRSCIIRFDVIFGIRVHMHSTESVFRFEQCKCSPKNCQIFLGCPPVKQAREDKTEHSPNRKKKVVCERQAINDKLTDFILVRVRVPTHVDGKAVAVACVTRTREWGATKNKLCVLEVLILILLVQQCHRLFSYCRRSSQSLKNTQNKLHHYNQIEWHLITVPCVIADFILFVRNSLSISRRWKNENPLREINRAEPIGYYFYFCTLCVFDTKLRNYICREFVFTFHTSMMQSFTPLRTWNNVEHCNWWREWRTKIIFQFRFFAMRVARAISANQTRLKGFNKTPDGRVRIQSQRPWYADEHRRLASIRLCAYSWKTRFRGDVEWQMPVFNWVSANRNMHINLSSMIRCAALKFTDSQGERQRTRGIEEEENVNAFRNSHGWQNETMTTTGNRKHIQLH